jgi:hypothetical protein
VNGEKRQFDWIDVRDPTSLKRFPIPQTAPSMPTLDSGNNALRLRWRVQANASAPEAYFLLDLSKDLLDVIDGRGHERRHLQCTNLSRKLAV